MLLSITIGILLALIVVFLLVELSSYKALIFHSKQGIKTFYFPILGAS